MPSDLAPPSGHSSVTYSAHTNGHTHGHLRGRRALSLLPLTADRARAKPDSYLARMLRLALLAPDLVEAILGGTEPDGLSLEKLYQVSAEREE